MPTGQTSRLTIDDIRPLPTINPAQVSRVLDMDEDSVLKALRSGDLPGFKIGRLWKIPVPRLLAMLDRRRIGGLRLVPLETGSRDPLLDKPDRPREPSGFGLSRRELLAEGHRLRALGWQTWELDNTLTHPREMAVAA